MVLLFAIFFTVSFSATAQIYVKIRPTIQITPRLAQPSPSHVWIDEDWEQNDGTYRYSGGRWVVPPRSGYYRKPGHWQKTRRGNRWIQGRWSKPARHHRY